MFAFPSGNGVPVVQSDRCPCPHRESAKRPQHNSGATRPGQPEQVSHRARKQASQRLTSPTAHHQFGDDHEREQGRDDCAGTQRQSPPHVFNGDIRVPQDEHEAEGGHQAKENLPERRIPARHLRHGGPESCAGVSALFCHGHTSLRIEYPDNTGR